MTQAACTRIRPLTKMASPVPHVSQLAWFVRQIVTQALHQPVPRVIAQVRDCTYVFDARTISRFYAADGYVAFTLGKSEYLLDESLSSLAARLEPHGFMKVHRGELINLDHIQCLRRRRQRVTVEFCDGSAAAVSRRLSAHLLRRLQPRIEPCERRLTAARRRPTIPRAQVDSQAPAG